MLASAASGNGLPAAGSILAMDAPTLRAALRSPRHEIWLPCPGATGSINGETHHGGSGSAPLAAVGAARRPVRPGFVAGGAGAGRGVRRTIAGQDDQGARRISG